MSQYLSTSLVQDEDDMKAGDLVRHKRSERGMTGIIVRIHVNKTPIVMWDDGRYGKCIPAYLEVIREGG